MATAELTSRTNTTQVLEVQERYTGDPNSAPNPDVNKNLAMMLRKAAAELDALDGNRFEAQGVEFHCDPENDPHMVLTIDLYDAEA